MNKLNIAQEVWDNLLPDEEDGYEEAFYEWCESKGFVVVDDNLAELQGRFEDYLKQFED